MILASTYIEVSVVVLCIIIGIFTLIYLLHCICRVFDDDTYDRKSWNKDRYLFNYRKKHKKNKRD